jgi:hypothetical protein
LIAGRCALLARRLSVTVALAGTFLEMTAVRVNLAGVREHVRAKQQSDDEQRRKYELLQQGCVQDKDRNGGRFSVNSVLAFCD